MKRITGVVLGLSLLVVSFGCVVERRGYDYPREHGEYREREEHREFDERRDRDEHRNLEQRDFEERRY